MDKSLNDDTLKLVRYKILFVKRDYEFAFPEQEALVWDNLDGAGFTAWKIAEFVQSLAKRKIHVPWKDYPVEKCFRDGDILLGLPEDDKKYLRVYYEVLERYPRERLKHQEDEVQVLREIRDAIGKKRSDTSQSTETQGGPVQQPGWRLRR